MEIYPLTAGLEKPKYEANRLIAQKVINYYRTKNLGNPNVYRNKEKIIYKLEKMVMKFQK